MTENAVQLVGEEYFRLVYDCFVCPNEWFKLSRQGAQWKDIDVLAFERSGKTVHLVACETYPESPEAWKRAKRSILDAEEWLMNTSRELIKGRNLRKWFIVDVTRPKRKIKSSKMKSIEYYENYMKKDNIIFKPLKEVIYELLEKLDEKYPRKSRRVGKEKTGARLLLHLRDNQFISSYKEDRS